MYASVSQLYSLGIQWLSHCGCHACPKIQCLAPTVLTYLADKLHNWCIQVILLLLEIHDIDMQVVFELFIYF